MHKCFIWLLRKTKKKMTTQPAMVYHALHKGTWKKKYDIILDEDRKNKWTNLARTKTTPNLCKCKLYLVSSKTSHLRFFFYNFFSIQKELILIKYEEPPRTCLSTFGAWNLRTMNYCWSPKRCSEQPHQSQRMWGAKQL